MIMIWSIYMATVMSMSTIIMEKSPMSITMDIVMMRNHMNTVMGSMVIATTMERFTIIMSIVAWEKLVRSFSRLP